MFILRTVTVSVAVGFILVFLMFLWQTPKQNEEILDPTKYIVTQMGQCLQAEKRSQCLKQAAKDFSERFSLQEVLAVFEKNEQKPELIATCHEETHYLSREEYQKKKNIRDVFASCNHSCLGGCFHGAVEGYFIEKNIAIGSEDDSEVSGEIPQICGQQKDYEKTQQHTECLHGLGHAVMFLTENDLIRSLKLCDNLKTKSEQELCFTGAFMANVDGA